VILYSQTYNYRMEGRKEQENVDEQLDRLNEVLAQTLLSARQAASSIDLPNSYLDDASEQSECVDYPRISVDYLVTDPGLYEFTYEGDFQEYTEALVLAMERAQMSLEDVTSRAMRAGTTVVVRTSQTTEMSQDDVGTLLEGLEKLQRTQFAAFKIGPITVEARVVADKSVRADLNAVSSPQSDQHEDFQVIWQVLQQQKAHLASKEQEFAKKEADFQAELTAFQQAKQLLSEEHERFVFAAKKQTADATTLKDRIELLLHEQQESVFDLESLCGTEIEQQSGARVECEAELELLRKQVKSLDLDSNEAAMIRQEMDLAEDVLVEVMNGENPKKLHLQVSVIKNRLLQFQGKQVIRDAEKMASSINSTILALENDRQFVKSKERIKEKLIRRLTTPMTSPNRSPRRSPVRSTTDIVRREALPVSKLTLDSIASPKGSPRRVQEPFLFPSKEPRTTMNKDDTLRRMTQELQETCQKQRIKLCKMAEKLDQYQKLEMKLVRDKANIAVKEKQLQLWKDLLKQKESDINLREVVAGEKEDQLRQSLARSVTVREARELLAITSKSLVEQSQKVAESLRFVEVRKAEVRLGEESINQMKALLDRERRVVSKVHARMERERKQVAKSKQELTKFMPELYSRIKLASE